MGAGDGGPHLHRWPGPHDERHAAPRGRRRREGRTDHRRGHARGNRGVPGRRHGRHRACGPGADPRLLRRARARHGRRRAGADGEPPRPARRGCDGHRLASSRSCGTGWPRTRTRSRRSASSWASATTTRNSPSSAIRRRKNSTPFRPSIPIYIVHQSGHIGAANTKALELARDHGGTPNPARRPDRDATRRANRPASSRRTRISPFW